MAGDDSSDRHYCTLLRAVAHQICYHAADLETIIQPTWPRPLVFRQQAEATIAHWKSSSVITFGTMAVLISAGCTTHTHARARAYTHTRAYTYTHTRARARVHTHTQIVSELILSPNIAPRISLPLKRNLRKPDMPCNKENDSRVTPLHPHTRTHKGTTTSPSG